MRKKWYNENIFYWIQNYFDWMKIYFHIIWVFISATFQQPYSDQSLLQTKSFLVLAETAEKQKLKFPRIALLHLKTRVCPIYFVHDCLWKQFFASNSPQSTSNLFLWTILVTMRLFTQFQRKIRATKLQKS